MNTVGPGALRIFLVDDEKPARVRLRQLLDDISPRLPTQVVGEACDGADALEQLTRSDVDVALLDIRMPRLDGLQAAERIRAGRGPSAAAPIIALSAEPDEQGRAKALESGMDDFLTKPIDAARLLTVAARFTERPNPATFAGE